MRIGLTLGKFSPLHRGHQLVIETAIKEMDHVIVLIYDAPEVVGCPLPTRVEWIRQLYPTVEILEAWDGPTETGLSPEITEQHDAYLKRRFSDRELTHFYSSEAYGEHVSKALGVVDRRVDEARETIPISATAIRAEVDTHRKFLDPIVYWDLLVKAVFVGAPSTGKTTLAKALAQKYHTKWIPEYGREYWEQHQVDRRLSREQLVEIAQGHRWRELETCLGGSRYLFVDTDATTTHQFCRYYHGDAPAELVELAKAAIRRYDIRFLCEADIPYDDTWDRSGFGSRAELQRRIEADLLANKVPFTRLSGTLEQRVETASRVMESLVGRFH